MQPLLTDFGDFDFVRDLSGETVTLETNDGNCTITSGADTCELVTIDPDEFPVVSRFEEEGTISLQGGSFTRRQERSRAARCASLLARAAAMSRGQTTSGRGSSRRVENLDATTATPADVLRRCRVPFFRY